MFTSRLKFMSQHLSVDDEKEMVQVAVEVRGLPMAKAKKINAAKLEAMGAKAVTRACIVHAEAAVRSKDNEDRRMFLFHCELLNQCAEIGRRMVKEGKARHGQGGIVDV